jgi:hypothetical protein
MRRGVKLGIRGRRCPSDGKGDIENSCVFDEAEDQERALLIIVGRGEVLHTLFFFLLLTERILTRRIRSRSGPLDKHK